MFLKCVESFETREGGLPDMVTSDEVYFRVGHAIADGGYEVAVLQRLGDSSKRYVRLERLAQNFTVVPMREAQGFSPDGGTLKMEEIAQEGTGDEGE